MTHAEQSLKVSKIQREMAEAGADSLLLRSIPAFLYLTGTVMQGFIYVPAEGEPLWFLEHPSDTRPVEDDSRIFRIRKPEEIPALLKETGYEIGPGTALELGQMPVSDFLRLSKLSASGHVSETDGSQILRRARMIKTADELEEMRRLAKIQVQVYRESPGLYRPCMTDSDWQHEIEYAMRRHGSIGLFRTYGWRMESFQGNVITGATASAPAPYDFAMGGRGYDAYPFGASGTVIEPGHTVMIDMAGNYGTLQTDMTRTYTLGEVPEEARRAHGVSLKMHEMFRETVRPGKPIAEVYNRCLQMADEAGLGDYFMGTKEWKSKFVGHGLGIEINELPVLTARQKGNFEEGMAIAFEPKFVLPEIGPVGAENTYIITSGEPENITSFPMDLIPLDKE